MRLAEKRLVPANPIYGEIIIRTLSSQAQTEMEKHQFPPEGKTYLVDGKFDMKWLFGTFQDFWRQNSDIWAEHYQYKEAAPHLILQAFLQTVINTGGSVSRELAEGTKRLDLCVHYQGIDYPIELKLRYGEKTYIEGKQQLTQYIDKLGCSEGWLIMFDRRKRVSWKKKIFWRTQHLKGNTIHIVGC